VESGVAEIVPFVDLASANVDQRLSADNALCGDRHVEESIAIVIAAAAAKIVAAVDHIGDGISVGPSDRVTGILAYSVSKDNPYRTA